MENSFAQRDGWEFIQALHFQMRLNFPHFFSVLLLAGAMQAGAADRAFQAYDATPIFGEDREVVRMGGQYVYRFPFRNGMVTYRPQVGAAWVKSSGDDSVGRIAAAPSENSAAAASRLPNSCLVFACARAEEIRLGVGRDRLKTNSQVISFRREDGTGHAFVVYQKNGQSFGEDDRGLTVPISAWQNRGGSEALRIAREFSVQTHPAGYSSPCQASFVGQY